MNEILFDLQNTVNTLTWNILHAKFIGKSEVIAKLNFEKKT